MTIHGIPPSKPNPNFELSKFKTFVPRYADYVDSEKGEISTLENSLESPFNLLGTSNLKVVFTNESLPKDLKVLNVNNENDIILGKDNSCYRNGYQLNSNIEIQNNEVVNVDIKIKYFLNGVVSFSTIETLIPGINIVNFEKPSFVTVTAGAILTVEVENDTLSDLDFNSFDNDVSSNFIAANGPGYALYELFCNISDNKILKNIWNSDWEFAFSYCVAHYIDLVNRETQKSFALNVSAETSQPRGIITKDDEKTYDFSLTTLNHRYAKFWQTTEFGRVLITLLQTKGIPSMLVVGGAIPNGGGY